MKLVCRRGCLCLFQCVSECLVVVVVDGVVVGGDDDVVVVGDGVVVVVVVRSLKCFLPSKYKNDVPTIQNRPAKQLLVTLDLHPLPRIQAYFHSEFRAWKARSNFLFLFIVYFLMENRSPSCFYHLLSMLQWEILDFVFVDVCLHLFCICLHLFCICLLSSTHTGVWVRDPLLRSWRKNTFFWVSFVCRLLGCSIDDGDDDDDVGGGGDNDDGGGDDDVGGGGDDDHDDD